MENMDRLLEILTEDQAQHNAPVSLMMIQEKVKSLILDLKSECGEESTVASFTIRRVWFQSLQNCCNLHNIKIAGEVASDDTAEKLMSIFNLKLLLVYHSENPRAVKGYAKTELPLIWKSNKMH
jgi:hypothetical protein